MAIDLAAMSTPELDELRTAVAHEIDRRLLLESAATRIDRILAETHAARGDVLGAAWTQPTGAHDSYPKGWTVTLDGKTWESTIPANPHRPGVEGWREIVPVGVVSAWKQPGSTNPYPLGAKVLHRGKTWESRHPANVWEPGIVGTESLWVAAA